MGTPVYTLYLAWLEETYGENKRESLWGWLDQMISQITLGNYEENTTIPGIIGQILLGLTDLDLLADLRDLSYDLIYWETSKEHFGQTALDVIGLLPLVGALKYGDEAADSVRAAVKNAEQIEFNKLNHIFGKTEHHLDGLLNSFGGDLVKAYDAIQNAANNYIAKYNIAGVINSKNEINVNVAGYIVTVRGIVIDGVLKIGTAFIKQ